MEDEFYLTYKTISLHKSDVRCLASPNYINDLIISFYYEILNDQFEANSSSFALLDPVVAISLISETTIEDLHDMIYAPLDLDNKKYVFLPINDNTSLTTPGSGNHWALCLIETETSTMFYFDSMGNTIGNVTPLIEQYEKLSKKKLTFVNALNRKYQHNMYDCGVFVLAFTEEVLNHLKSNEFKCDLKEVDFDKIMTESSIANQSSMNNLRKKIQKILVNLKKQKG